MRIQREKKSWPHATSQVFTDVAEGAPRTPTTAGRDPTTAAPNARATRAETTTRIAVVVYL